MTFEERLAAAHQELANKGGMACQLQPPLVLVVAPTGLVCQTATLRELAYQLSGIWHRPWTDLEHTVVVFSWQPMGMDLLFAIRQTAFFAGLIGLIMASVLRLRHKQLKLTPWEQLAEPSDTDDEGDELNESP